MDPHGPTIAPSCPTAVIADKIKHTHFQKESEIFSAYHKRPALMQPVCTAVSTPCHAGRGLAGHPRCVNVGNDYGKMRLCTPIRSKSTTLSLCAQPPQCAARTLKSSAQRWLICWKGAIEIVPPAQSESGFYSHYFLVPKKDGGLRPFLDLRICFWSYFANFRKKKRKSIL